jgi:hypothetical protein
LLQLKWLSEDYVERSVHNFGNIADEADEIAAFAKQFDRQDFQSILRLRSSRLSAVAAPTVGTPPD